MINIKEDKCIGMTNTMHNGMKATIVAYRNDNDLDVQFEDGHVAYNKTISLFKIGYIAHPKDFIGMTNTMNNGMKATIIAYRGMFDIDVEFEDGTVVQHKQMGNFKMGYIAYPKFKRG